MTFSIAAKCEKTGAFGAAIATSSIAVTSRCVWVSPNTGVVLSQNITDPKLGQLGLGLLAQGFGSEGVLQQLKTARPYCEWRQLAVLDFDGKSTWFSGKEALGIHSGAIGKNCVAIGNLLENENVPTAMVDSFEKDTDSLLPERLLNALKAGLTAGGEKEDEHSAGVIVYGLNSWPIADLRVDWDEDPINKLIEIWKRYKPQMNDYLLRAKDPANAPDY